MNCYVFRIDVIYDVTFTFTVKLRFVLLFYKCEQEV